MSEQDKTFLRQAYKLLSRGFVALFVKTVTMEIDGFAWKSFLRASRHEIPVAKNPSDKTKHVLIILVTRGFHLVDIGMGMQNEEVINRSTLSLVMQ